MNDANKYRLSDSDCVFEWNAREQISIMGLLSWIVSFFYGIIRYDVNVLINRLGIFMLLSLHDIVMLLSTLLKLYCELN